ncbi:Ribonucleoside-diphosphate reductase 1 subunit alpha [Raoultella planticola]|uniref:Ribonucleoside-diphosphate reductase 1 subunit alpha n=1 Tax=Raoultella planticola TaxID=575 RepID=A0A485AHT0_RAOPL|nr:Ribonucleoside-diphosphate reductase 1 subunit alpha [Raoultella planticola]
MLRACCRSIPIKKISIAIVNGAAALQLGSACASPLKSNGLRNSTLSALMPSETSSQISNATNGIEAAARTCQH